MIHLRQENYTAAVKDIAKLMKSPITGQEEDILDALDEIVKKCPDDHQAWDYKAKIRIKTGDYKDASMCFEKACELDPPNAGYHYGAAHCLLVIDCLEEALTAIEKAIELDGGNARFWREKAEILEKTKNYDQARRCFQQSIQLEPDDIEHKLRFLQFLIYHIRNMDEAGDYLKELESTSGENVQDSLAYLHYKSEYLILIFQFEEAAPWAEKRLKKDPGNRVAKVVHLIDKACLGEFGDNMEGLAAVTGREILEESRIIDITEFIFMLMENCLSKGKTRIVNGLYMTLVKLDPWHTIEKVQEIIALYLRKLVDFGDRELFINAAAFAREHVNNEDLLELLKAFLYAGRYMAEGNKVILEEVFPEIRDIIFDIVETFDKKSG
jgi:tetratricopeptide (TPR) repeat protein